MAETESVKELVRKFILETAQIKGVKDVGEHDSLTDSGIIDSLGIFRLVSYLEETVGVHVGDDEITQDNFRTIADIERFVSGKLATSNQAAPAH
jgi:acyl carrier protein